MSDAPAWLTQLAEGSLDEVSELGSERLRVTSGRVVGCDPLVFLTGADPFAREVPAGRYEVAVGEVEGETAYSIIRFAKGQIARWEVARCPGEEDVEGWPGYGVDSGIGCFVDYDVVKQYAAEEEALSARVAAKLAEEGVDPSDVLAYHEAIERHRAEMGGDDPLARLETSLSGKPLVSLDIAGGNLVAFRTGVGDGVYASFWGFGARGKLLALVTDFGMFGEADDEGEGDEEDDELGALEDELGDELSLEDELGDVGGLDALAAALGLKPEPEPETRQGPSPLFLQSRDLLKSWVRTEKIELEPDANLDAFAEAFLEKLVSLTGQRYPGAHIAEWLLERPEVADVFASDDEIEADLTR
ncbi:MAG: DUF4241 domain-containing protein [Sandaracinaceae bacterium]|nr:DUF4241 domain-containing protein [Sandaracinaceae bacterium]